jgi:hypothetical protein
MNESAVLDLDELETEAVCPGCEKPLNLLKNYLEVTYKTKRNVIVEVDPNTIGAEADPETAALTVTPRSAEERVDEDEDSAAYYLGTRAGAPMVIRVHDFGCAKRAMREDETKTNKEGLKLKLHLHDEHAEGRSNE